MKYLQSKLIIYNSLMSLEYYLYYWINSIDMFAYFVFTNATGIKYFST